MVNCHQCSYGDAFINFDLALTEQRNAIGKCNPGVAEMLAEVIDFQCEAGKLIDAIDKYLEALMIQRFVHGNTHSKVLDVLVKIGFIHKLKYEYKELLNAFHQSLFISENIVDTDSSITLIILNEICLIYQLMGDAENAINVSRKMIETIKLHLGNRHFCVASALGFFRNIHIENGMIEGSKVVAEEMCTIINNPSNHLHYEFNDDFMMRRSKRFIRSLYFLG